jgi:hypothetical protein
MFVSTLHGAYPSVGAFGAQKRGVATRVTKIKVRLVRQGTVFPCQA